jgi:hypothetical protein
VRRKSKGRESFKVKIRPIPLGFSSRSLKNTLGHNKIQLQTMNSNTVVPAQSLVLIVDPYSTGCMVAQEISKRGYPIMA